MNLEKFEYVMKKMVIIGIVAVVMSSCGQSSLNKRGSESDISQTEQSDSLTFGQVVFTVEDFSENYVGKVYITDTTEVFSKGWVAIFEKKSGRQLIKVDAEALSFDLHDGKLLANIKEIPYGEQSVIMYEDYNFDGKNDFAIMDGQNSCYHGPSFKIFLATDNGFEYSKEFTRLAQEYCGMFDVDYDKKQISTMTKSGCYWHEYSIFIVENNKPKVIEIVIEDCELYPFCTDSIKRWDGTKMIETTETKIDLGGDAVDKIILNFQIDKSEKDIVLFISSGSLCYVVIDKNGLVEFSYPMERIYKNPDFTFETKKNTITFKNKDVIYSIYDETSKVGIEINIDGKIYYWVGNNETKEGTINDLLNAKPDNVIIE